MAQTNIGEPQSLLDVQAADSAARVLAVDLISAKIRA